ncbi:MAG: DUF5916 domain-containing protein [Bacteroidota bacterium]
MNKAGLFFYLTLSLTGLKTSELLAQARNMPGHGLAIAQAKQAIVIDGVLDEEDWKLAEVATNFYLNYPVDSIPSPFQTEVRLTFDDNFFYLSFVCFDDDKPNVVQSLRRDYDWSLNDNVGVYMDPFNDFTNGFYFHITPYGVQREGSMSAGGTGDNGYNPNWDNKWYSSVKRLEDRWIAELAIPFKSFRYNQGQPVWNMNFVRQDLKRNQVSSWIAAPIQFFPSALAWSGKVHWQTPAPHAGTNISFIPYGITTLEKDNEAGTSGNTLNAGFDAKVAITPSLNLDLTVNPDFSTVEVDRQVINLSRFEFQYPERRQFFLENSDLFSSPGFTSYSQPFFSRRIGLATDSAGFLQKVPILFGARISGKIGPDWRLGLMNMQTKETPSLGLPGQNYTVAVLQRQIFKRSNVGIFMVDKESLGLKEYDPKTFYHESLVKEVWNGTGLVRKLNTYNRVAGIDFNLITTNNKWGGKAYYHQSFDDFSEGDNFSYGFSTNYNVRSFNASAGFQGLGKDFNAEVGFVPSKDVYPGLFSPWLSAGLKFYPKSGPLVLIQPGIAYDETRVPDGTLSDRNLGLTYSMSFRNTALFTAAVRNVYQQLQSDFNALDPKGDSTFLKGELYHWNEFDLRYTSNTRKLFTYMLRVSGGGYYSGNRESVSGMISYRVQPFGSFSLTGDYNHIALPPAYGTVTFLLLSPRVDFTLTDKIFFTTFVQYNGRYDNVNLNARFQWRYKPASDFFIVYTENYLPEHLMSKNSALVLKLTYWLNL